MDHALGVARVPSTRTRHTLYAIRGELYAELYVLAHSERGHAGSEQLRITRIGAHKLLNIT